MKKSVVLSVGMPRAGTGWFHNITQNLVLAAGGVPASKVRTKYHLGSLLTEVNCNIGTVSFYRIIPVTLPLLLENSYVIKLHAGRRPVADLMIAAGVIKPTFIYRDPRDAALSIYEYGKTAQEHEYVNNDFAHIRTIEQAIDYIAPYIEFARGWISHPETLVVKYEDMFSDFDRIIQSLVSYLELELPFDEARNVVDDFRPGVNLVGRRFTHFKKGKVGRYQEYFSPQQIDYSFSLFGDFLEDFGYDVSTG